MQERRAARLISAVENRSAAEIVKYKFICAMEKNIMNRRDFVRIVAGAAAAAPFAGYAREAPFQGPTPGTLQIYLEGPFAVVLKKDSIGQIQEVTAYAPVEKEDTPREHEFHLHGKHDKNKEYTLTLAKDGLLTSSSIGSVSTQFNLFMGKAFGPPKLKSFITINLPPAPEQIIFFSSTPATQEGVANDVPMPLDHVLVYNVQNINQVIMTCDKLPTSFPDKIGPNSGQFHIQVGLPRGGDPDGSKAVQFFNDRLLGAFPNSGVKKLTHVGPHTEGADIECKNGGLLLTQP